MSKRRLLRESGVAKLRLDDIDWEHDQLRIPRAKQREAQVYPLLPSVGRALTDYLLSVRRPTSHREIFLTLVSQLPKPAAQPRSRWSESCDV
jgi:integrase/recombinase XerD